MFTRATSLILALLIPMALTTTSLAATKGEMGVVINLVGTQRMLTQKMSKEMLLIAKGMYVEDTLEELAQSAKLFDKTLKGLAGGDATPGLPATADKAILKQLAVVDKLWTAFRKNVEAVLNGDTSRAVMQTVAIQNLPLLKEMNTAVQMYADLSGSKLDPGLAATINLSGKQRMLTQKATKELFLVANEIDVTENQANMEKTAALFERTLKGLRDGDAELGLPGTKDEEIIDQLGIVETLWDAYKPILFSGDTSENGLAIAAEINLPLLEEMNAAVKMYEQLAK